MNYFIFFFFRKKYYVSIRVLPRMDFWRVPGLSSNRILFLVRASLRATLLLLLAATCCVKTSFSDIIPRLDNTEN